MSKRATLTESEYYKLMELRGKYKTDDLTDVLGKLSEIPDKPNIDQKTIDILSSKLEELDSLKIRDSFNDLYRSVKWIEVFLSTRYSDFKPTEKHEQKQADETKQPEKQESAGSKLFDF
jgi:hypothetical protein